MSVFVKICGMARASDVEAVAAMGPDALGFIFWPGSKRFVRAADVAAWCRGLPAGLLRVGVFVDAPEAVWRETAETAGLDVIQWHGETACPRPNSLAGLRLWQVAYPGRTPPEACAASPAEALVADTYRADLPGGTGVPQDWNAAAAWVRACGKPVLLAGGLHPGNVEEALRTVRPWGVDVSSGVEAAPGRKDLDRVKEFIQLCRQW